MERNRSRFGRPEYVASARGRARALLVVMMAAAALAVPNAASAGTTLIGSGSSAAQPYMLALFAAYHKLHRSISFRYTPDGGNAGVKDVQGGISEFAIQTAAPLVSQKGVSFTKFFKDGLCIDVNSRNHLSNLTLKQLAGIFQQPPTYTTWSQLGSKLGNTPISTQGRNSAAGQFTFFQAVVLNGAAENSSTSQLTSDGLVKVAIQKNAGAIGYVGLANSGVKGETPAKGEHAISINGVACSVATVKNETYPLWRYDWFVLPQSRPNSTVLRFLAWARTSAAAGKILAAAGAVPAFNR